MTLRPQPFVGSKQAEEATPKEDRLFRAPLGHGQGGDAKRRTFRNVCSESSRQGSALPRAQHRTPQGTSSRASELPWTGGCWVSPVSSPVNGTWLLSCLCGTMRFAEGSCPDLLHQQLAVYCSPVKPSPLPVTGNEVWWERSQAHLVQITWDSFQGPRDRAE